MTDSNLRMQSDEERELSRLLGVAAKQLTTVEKTTFNNKEQQEKLLNGKIVTSAKALVKTLKTYSDNGDYDDLRDTIDNWRGSADVQTLLQLSNQGRLSLSKAAILCGAIDDVRNAANNL
jgi:hypothetical protein